MENLADKLPYGSGHLKWHHGSWWISYRDEHGKQKAENTRTTERDHAVRVLARHAIKRLNARIQVLQEIAYEAPWKAAKEAAGRTGSGDHGKGQPDNVSGQSGSGGSVRKNAPRGARTKSYRKREANGSAGN